MNNGNESRPTAAGPAWIPGLGTLSVSARTSNASRDEDVNVNRLFVRDCRADDGPLLNNRLRWRPGPQGRAMPYRKRTSHLTVIVQEREE